MCHEEQLVFAIQANGVGIGIGSSQFSIRDGDSKDSDAREWFYTEDGRTDHLWTSESSDVKRIIYLIQIAENAEQNLEIGAAGNINTVQTADTLEFMLGKFNPLGFTTHYQQLRCG